MRSFADELNEQLDDFAVLIPRVWPRRADLIGLEPIVQFHDRFTGQREPIAHCQVRRRNDWVGWRTALISGVALHGALKRLNLRPLQSLTKIAVGRRAPVDQQAFAQNHVEHASARFAA